MKDVESFDINEPRVEQWKRKLLDLSLRNPLLNVRESSKFLPLEDGVKFSGGATTTAVAPYVPPEAGTVVPYKTRLTEKEVRKRLKELYTTSRSIFMESGINPLYVVVGFLNWNEEDGGEFHRAPLVLIPAQLVRQTAAPGFKLMRTDEDASVNFCLVEMLRTLFGIPVKDVPGGGFDDGDPDFGEVFRVFADAIQNRKEWFITTDISLGIFSFSKIVIWKDLADNFEKFRLHPFVVHLAERKGLFDDRISVFPQEEVERHIHPERLFCPLSADSSQLAAVLYSEFGKSFVLHGPPGTGKSQTITNIIAHNLVLGKRILFVSEKKAALDVVHKRLTDVGLAPFCLELHSNKADKANVMRQFKAALEVAVSHEAEHWSETCANLEAGHKELAVYVRELHKRCPNGMNVHDCIAKYGFRSPCASGRLIAFDVAACTSESLGGVRETLSKVINEWRCVNREAFAVFRNMLKAKVWSLQFQMRVERQVGEYLAILSDDNCVRRLGRLVWKSLLMVFSGTIRFPIFASRKEQMERMMAVKDNLEELRLTMSYLECRKSAVEAGCEPFLKAMEAGEFSVEEALKVFDDSCAENTLNTIIAASPVLSGFSGLKQEERIARFRELDEKYTKSVRQMVIAKLSRLMPDPDALESEAERQMAIIKHESEKKKRFMPPRRLLAETMDVAVRLKPCFLMSPLSVAQYLPPRGDMFDMVVFDEASQMTVWDAVGIIARAKQFIVVGDPKQLPPTDFFMKGDVAEEDRENDPAVEDLESILDECIANGVHSAYLNWHYRSRHESLIAFSNRHYYGDRLNTFPAAENKPTLGVSFRYVDGALYDHNTHTNEVEARALVDFLFERLENAAERERSWGIVTFCVAQQRLIQRMVDERAPKCSWAAEFFDDTKSDAFFVKNLENVQGDERDVVLFSIAYAPDAEGNFAMMFGPINRQGGERRLNVAITRAKEQVVIFASAHPCDIHVERTNSVGVKHLRYLMDYAATGRLEGDVPADEKYVPCGVKKLVCDCLAAHGYEFEVNVGRSTYPIDIAVRNPMRSDRFILGIECDGVNYAQQRTVRDRDILRESVLKGLGWRIFRAWSVDWAFDRERTEKRLLDLLAEIVKDNPG